jgi:beta-N-acetylhexosaminidase
MQRLPALDCANVSGSVDPLRLLELFGRQSGRQTTQRATRLPSLDDRGRWAPTPREVAVVLMALSLVWVASRLRTPLLASVRGLAMAAVGLIALALIVLSMRSRAGAPGDRPGWRAVGIALSALALCLGGARELAFQQARAMVLNAEPGVLARLGSHIIVGYENFEELASLVERRAIAGVFLTARNVRGRSLQRVGDDIARLQSIRHAQHAVPLWVTADQEGGEVSRMSPPLARPLPLSAFARLPDRYHRVERHARAVAGDLSMMGINLNLAPVIDVDHGLRSLGDRHTRISRRAISTSIDSITDVAAGYCDGLTAGGVLCTLKHFPGLGRVRDDTHVQSAVLDASIPTLQSSDWAPFRRLIDRHAEVMMLGHVIVSSVDATTAASYSERIVNGLLRNDWHYRGLLLTDDFCMAAVHDSAEGIGGASVRALNAGVDLILVAYDPDQYYFVMQALMLADRRGELDDARIRQSGQRLERILAKMRNLDGSLAR